MAEVTSRTGVWGPETGRKTDEPLPDDVRLALRLEAPSGAGGDSGAALTGAALAVLLEVTEARLAVLLGETLHLYLGAETASSRPGRPAVDRLLGDLVGRAASAGSAALSAALGRPAPMTATLWVLEDTDQFTAAVRSEQRARRVAWLRREAEALRDGLRGADRLLERAHTRGDVVELERALHRHRGVAAEPPPEVQGHLLVRRSGRITVGPLPFLERDPAGLRSLLGAASPSA